MMPVADNIEDEYADPEIDYKEKYKTLKKKLRLLVYEQECFLDELRKAQRKLLKVSRDRSFLLDRLLQQEKFDDSSEESEATNSTDTEEGGGHIHHREAGPAKKRKLASQNASSTDVSQMLSAASSKLNQGPSESHNIKKKGRNSGKKGSKSNSKSLLKQESPGHMTREELERHLESKQHEFKIEKASATLPMDIFSNDPNQDSDNMLGEDEEDDLVIDVPH